MFRQPHLSFLFLLQLRSRANFLISEHLHITLDRLRICNSLPTWFTLAMVRTIIYSLHQAILLRSLEVADPPQPVPSNNFREFWLVAFPTNFCICLALFPAYFQYASQILAIKCVDFLFVRLPDCPSLTAVGGDG